MLAPQIEELLKTNYEILKVLRSLDYVTAYQGELSRPKQISCVPMGTLTKVIGDIEVQNYNLRRELLKLESNE